MLKAFSHITRSQNEAEGLPEQAHRDVAFSLNFMKRSLQHLIMPFEECIEFPGVLNHGRLLLSSNIQTTLYAVRSVVNGASLFPPFVQRVVLPPHRGTSRNIPRKGLRSGE